MSKNVLKTIRLTSSALAISLVLCAAPSAFAEARTYTFNIPAESTAKALMDFSRQAKIQILFPYEVVADHASPAISGEYDRATVLKLLLDGSGLEIARETDQVITLKAVGEADKTSSVSDPDAPTEVVITGTHIRGGNPTSPIHTVTRTDIDQSGYSQIGDLMRSLPENFSGGQNPGVIAASAVDSAQGNSSNASTINLRGLGTDATLVLLNGHRLSGDSLFQGVDISGIPLGAVQRMEIVSDGASALYGSDAVAGVVNIVLRKNFDGTEIKARVGQASQGGGEEQTYSVLTGISRPGWYALGNLEYAKNQAITAGDRDFTAGVTPITTLWQPQVRRSLFLSAGVDINTAVSLTFDGLLNDRDTSLVQQTNPASYIGYNTTYTPAYSATTTLKFALPQDWSLKLVAGAAGSRNRNIVEIPTYAYVNTTRFQNIGDYIEIGADGTLFDFGTGPVKAAIGAGYRTEGFKQNLPGSASYIDVERNVTSAYLELQVPLVRPSADRVGLKSLDLSLAARSETYSDFGSSTNPKIGVRYVPFDDIALRATWGSSFKAPSFSQMYSAWSLYLYTAPGAGYTGPVAGATDILSAGGNKDLKPEQSKSWTLGADYSPKAIPTLKVSATWFDIEYTDRVVQPVANVVAAFSDPVYSPFLERDPTAARQAELIAAASSFTNYSGLTYDPAKVVGIVHNTYQNATGQTVSGADLSYRQDFDIGAGILNAFANATWLELKQQTLSTMPTQVLSGTIFHAPKFRARGGATWTQAGFSATGIVNFVADEEDNLTTAHRTVGSWTTIDANLAYRFSEGGAFRGTQISVAVSNLFDRDPPRVTSPSAAYAGIYYDSTNTSIIGRFVSLTVLRAW